MDKIKARNVINHDYISCLALVLWLGHLRESQNLSFRQFCVQEFRADTKLLELAKIQRGRL